MIVVSKVTVIFAQECLTCIHFLNYFFVITVFDPLKGEFVKAVATEQRRFFSLTLS